MNIFDEIGDKESVFKDKKYLDHRFLPDRLPHREEQIRSIAKYWVEALNGVTPPDITIYGKTGTGKTAVAKFAMKQLKEASKDCDVNIRTEYIRCTDYTTEYQVIARLCQQLGRDVPYRGWTKAEIVNTFRNMFKKNAFGQDMILMVVLDEIDILLRNDGDGLLYTLTRTDNVSILSISNYVEFKKFIKPRVRSSLRDREIVFPPYGAQQLVDILEERSKMSFKEGALDDDVIPLCAALAAKEEGDARYALDLLRTAGEIADERDSDKVLGDFVREAKDYIEHNKITDIILTLPSQQQRVLEAILYLTKRKEEITSGRLYEVYKEIAKGDSVSYRRIFDFINELEMLGLISTNTVSRGRGKGRTNIIDLQCETSLLEDSLWGV
ncbi:MULTISPECIES: ORC1-type DNA replication protein Cdc6-1 [Methanothermobacter]|jgi:cell division control protein 6|uniref:ORC1-type DNA replication protein 1 n=1 Tax=Methanothermobacter thermautotrophicus (strain ATCC 29096 / DSM 1053 / JCM 10044 / NBRC 100330 / Delta H) TaxID=187420 RepID=CDC61_METTH|nr:MULTISPECIES: ORC1-type DNA replication protein Cdc6-1 [Methanothermobacter]O27463.1 RecName: Full=ORC1-type DNA replication protein 1 [Methanothermobacter thermautotrophicus str. Delta H]MBC7110905.1 orc1/cdc6 family replication initiation protein [Methanothermobacter sp.]AAB85889.1 Cdc6 related protein [Methanothermobacter thermautotrophicus str. Delta H]MDI6818216.1 ORC1-type DNA replication protein Cdc6-1 [Methanothermobacter thermautotrophicus]MDK2874884.1 archaeal cell division contro